MSRISRNMGDSGKLRFYELDHESKMRLLKTHSHTSNGLAMEPGTREEKQLKETQTVRAEKKTDQPPPDSGVSRCQLSPSPGERHQLPPRRSTGHHRRHLGSPCLTERHPQSSRDRGAHAAPSGLAYSAARAQRALDDANQTISRRREGARSPRVRRR